MSADLKTTYLKKNIPYVNFISFCVNLSKHTILSLGIVDSLNRFDDVNPENS